MLRGFLFPAAFGLPAALQAQAGALLDVLADVLRYRCASIVDEPLECRVQQS
jgi:hypothetical protein